MAAVDWGEVSVGSGDALVFGYSRVRKCIKVKQALRLCRGIIDALAESDA